MLEQLLQQVKKEQSPKKRHSIRRRKSIQRPRSAAAVAAYTVKANDPSRRWIIEREKLERQLGEEEVKTVKEMIKKQVTKFYIRNIAIVVIGMYIFINYIIIIMYIYTYHVATLSAVTY